MLSPFLTVTTARTTTVTGSPTTPQTRAAPGPNRGSSELSNIECDDGLDNDGDGLTDVPDDPGCDDPTDPSEQSTASTATTASTTTSTG